MTQSRPDNLQQVIGEMRIFVSEITALRSELATFKATVGPTIAVIQGDGQRQPLATIVAVLQRDLEHVTGSVAEAKAKIKEVEARADANDRDARHAKIGLIGTLIAATVGLIGAVINFLIGLTKH